MMSSDDFLTALDVLMLLPASSLATWASLNAWFQGSIFVGVRKRIGAPGPQPRLYLFSPWLLRYLAGCRFCLGFHIPLWPALIWFGAVNWYPVLLLSLGSSAAAWILDHLLPEAVSIDALEELDGSSTPIQAPAILAETSPEALSEPLALSSKQTIEHMLLAASEALQGCQELETVSMAWAWQPLSTEKGGGITVGKGGDARFPSELLRAIASQSVVLEAQARRLEGLVAGVVKMGNEAAKGIADASVSPKT